MSDDYYAITAEPAQAGPGETTTSRLLLSGSFDIGAREDLRDRILDLVDGGTAGRIVLDVHRVGFIDSEAISAIIEGLIAAERAGLVLRIANPHGIVKRVFEIIGLERLLDLSG